MYNIKEMVDVVYNKYRNEEKYNCVSDSKLYFLSRLEVYQYLRYKVPHKARVMSFDVYSDYMRLEMSILISDLNYKGHRNLKNGYDHLYNEMQPLFNSLSAEEKKELSSACLEFASDIYNIDKIEKYLKHEAIKTYVRFVSNRYKNVIHHYDLDKDYVGKCNQILNMVGVNKSKSRA